MKDFLEVGEFTTTHGINGELRLYPWCDDIDFLLGFKTLYLDKNGTKPLPVISLRPHKNLCIAKLENVNSIENARVYIGKTVYIARKDAKLAPDTYFVQDLLGASIQDADNGTLYGKITAITHPGRHDVYEIAMPCGETVFFPATQPFLVETRIDDSLILVRPIPGMFDPEPKKPKTPRKKKSTTKGDKA